MPPSPITFSVKKERMNGKSFIIIVTIFVVTIILLPFSQVTSSLVWNVGI